MIVLYLRDVGHHCKVFPVKQSQQLFDLLHSGDNVRRTDEIGHQLLMMSLGIYLLRIKLIDISSFVFDGDSGD